MRRTACVILLASALVIAAPSLAVAAGDDVWGEVALGGGVPAARAAFGLGTSEGRFDAGVLVDFVRRYSRAGAWPQALGRLRRYLAVVETLEASADQTPGGIRPPDADGPRDVSDRFRAFAQSIGLEVHRDGSVLRVAGDSSPAARERAAWLVSLGLDANDIATQWNAGNVVPLTLPVAHLPLPLPGFWKDLAGQGAVSIETVFRDRESALLYAGLMALDDETLAWLDEHRDLVARIRTQAPAAFAAFAGSLRVHGGVVDVPGGKAAWDAWKDVAGRSPGDPQEFLTSVLVTDGGRLAFFLDALSHLPAPTAAAVAERAIARPPALARVYRAFQNASTGWFLQARPFERPLSDPAWALALVDLRGSTLTGPPWLAEMLDRVVEEGSWPKAPAPLPTTLPAGDIEWIARWLFARPPSMMARARLLRFAQRLSPLASASSSDTEFALRTFQDLPVLALTLERLGIVDPEVVSRVGRAAYALSRGGAPDVAAPLVSRWQASLALLEQSSRLRPLSHGQIVTLVLALADAAERPTPLVTDAILHWLTDDFIPALVPDRAVQWLDVASLSRAVVGDTMHAGLRVTFEGLAYDRNPTRATARDLDGMVLGAAANRADVSVLGPARLRLEQGFQTLQDARDLAAAFDAARSSVKPGGAASPAMVRLNKQLEVAAAALRTRPMPADPGRAAERFPEVFEVFGQAVDAVIEPVVYALAMTPLHQPAALQADAWSFHELVSPSSSGSDWWRTAWQKAVPGLRPGGGSALIGSWLSIDLALAEAMVPRRFDQGADLPSQIRDAIFRDVAVRLHASTFGLVGLDQASGQLSRGHHVLDQWVSSPPDAVSARHAVEALAMGPTRANLALWTVLHEPRALASNLTISEVARLGGLEAHAIVAESIDGCICVINPPARSIDDARGSWRFGVTTAMSNDVALALADSLPSIGLPLEIIDDLLPLVTADWLAHIEPYANDDWEALTLWPRRLTQGEIEGYVLQLVTEGNLAPVEEVVP